MDTTSPRKPNYSRERPALLNLDEPRFHVLAPRTHERMNFRAGLFWLYAVKSRLSPAFGTVGARDRVGIFGNWLARAHKGYPFLSLHYCIGPDHAPIELTVKASAVAATASRTSIVATTSN